MTNEEILIKFNFHTNNCTLDRGGMDNEYCSCKKSERWKALLEVLCTKDAEIKSLKAELEKANNYIKSFGEAMNDYHQAYLKESRKVDDLRKETKKPKDGYKCNCYYCAVNLKSKCLKIKVRKDRAKHQCTKFCRPEENSHIEIKAPKSGEEE